jgi:hypothetical protein
LPDNDPLAIRLEEIQTTKEWLLKFVPDPIKQINSFYQPFHPIFDTSCRAATESASFNMLTAKIAEGKTNNAHGLKTDIYILGVADAARPPSNKILANMTTSSENGEFLSVKRITQIPGLFTYMVQELNRIAKQEQSKRYIWNKNNGRKN